MRRSTRFNRPGLSGSSRSAMLLGADGDGSTLTLDFTTGILDPRLTFTRGTTATFINSQGLVQYANANIIRQSENCGSWSGAQNITPTADAAIAPNGTQTADQLNLLASSYRYQVTSTTYAVGQPYVGSIWMRTVSGTASVGFRIANSVTGANNAIATCSVTETWQRFTTPAFTLSDSANRVIDIGIDQRSIVSGPNVAANIYVWGLQLQPGTSADEYLPTTTTENLNVPRFDHDPSTQAPRGLLIEGTATNLVTYSDLRTTGWAGINATGTNDNATAPNNTTTATLWTGTSGGLNRAYSAGFSVTSGTTYTISAWVKKPSSNAARYAKIDVRSSIEGLIGWPSNGTLDLDTGTISGTGYTVTPYQNGWYRIVSTGTVNSTTTARMFVRITDASGGEPTVTTALLWWGAQAETGSGASSYIPTGASQATRNADSCVMTGTNFSSWYNQSEGSFFARVQKNTTIPGHIFNANTSNNAPRIMMTYNSGWFLSGENPSGTNTPSLFITTGAINAAQKFAGAFQTGNYAASANGLTAVTTSTGTMPTGLNTLQIGAAEGGYQFFSGTIALLKYWPTRLTNAQLQSLTT